MKRRLAIVSTPAPTTRDEKVAAAIAWLGQRYVLHSHYQRKVRAGSYLTGWLADWKREQGKASNADKPAASIQPLRSL